MKSQPQQSTPRSLPGYKLQSYDLGKASMCVWKEVGLWFCWSRAKAEASRGHWQTEVVQL